MNPYVLSSQRERSAMSQIKDMLKLENVQIVDAAKDWEDAVRIAVTPLVKGGYVEECYIDGIIANAHELGPYFVLVPNLALLHARPEQGVIKKQLALTILRTGTVFKEGQAPTSVLLTLAAEDSNSHIQVMRELATLLSDPKNIEALAQAKNEHEAYQLMVSEA